MPHPKSILPDPLRPPTTEEIARARDMYAQGFTVARCLAAANMSLGTLYYWLDGGPYLAPTTDQSAVGGDAQGARMLPPIPRRRVVVGKRRKPLAPDLVSVTARLTRTLAREALDIERRLAEPSDATPERERNVRMLAQLVQSVRVLATLVPGEAAGAGGGAEPDDDPVPDNIDEFRYELARRIRGFVAARQAQQAEGEVEAGE
jgi:hypothetical protein